MGKRILIDTSKNEETRIAVTVEEKLDDYEIESEKQIAVKGNVYLAKITRVEPSLQAAFVDFGSNRNGFLPLTEIHPDYFKIPVADQERIFTKLYRASNATRNEPDGTGLGLYIVKEAIDVLRGKISFTSVENVSTTFDIILPINQ